jgi:uroporphyrinogen-III decarboxylase
MCCRFAFGAAAEVAAALKASGGLLIYHTGDASLSHLAKEAQLPVHAVNVGEGCRLAGVTKLADFPICLMGNFDPMLLRDGSREEVARSAADMVCENLPGGRYIFNTGESVMCNTPVANVAAMFDAVKRAAREQGK